jgi:SAM-dependent methyltransferase
MGAPPPFYSRPGLNVETYDARCPLDIGRSSVEGDAAWYARRAAAWGGPVLEAACGTGRVAWAIAEAGLEVSGFDLSGPMLAAAGAKRAGKPPEVAARADFRAGDMADFDLARTYSTILVPFRAFQALLTPALQRAALGRFREHLAPSGRLVLDLFDPRYEYLTPTAPPALAARDTVRHPERGTLVTVEMVREGFDPVAQVLRDAWTFREHARTGEVLREETELLELRWSFRWEMRHLFEICGLRVEEEWSDFKGGKGEYGKEQVWVLIRD